MLVNKDLKTRFMKNKFTFANILLVIFVIIIAGCAKKDKTPDVYIVASSQGDLICAGDAVSVHCNIYENGSAVNAWHWYFKNGTPSSFEGKTPPNIVFTSGSCSIRLVVETVDGLTCEKTSKLEVIDCK